METKGNKVESWGDLNYFISKEVSILKPLFSNKFGHWKSNI